VPPAHWMTPAEEIERYQLHSNRIDDVGYVRFLMPVIDALRRHGASGRVLDYGAGPSPVLLELLTREGFDAHGYDPNFACRYPSGGVTLAGGSFDAVVSTEVFEHFREPAREMDRIQLLVKPGGLLVVMTAFATNNVSMGDWHYANDATHIVFYSKETLQYIARRWGFTILDCCLERLVVMRRGL
jgi:hypothetical protein